MDANNSSANDRDTSFAETGSVSRREALLLLGAGAMASTISGCAAGGSTPAPTAELAEPLYYSSTRAMAAGVRSGSISSEELVQSCLDRIEEVNGSLNAVFQIQGEVALAQAREADQARANGAELGALHGVPMTIKDSLDTAGVITTGGTAGRAAFVPSADSTAVARLRQAGAILLGKTNTPEFTLSYETNNLVYGRTNNPFQLDRTPGGSSGGAAAIVASGGAPFDIGSDYGGSIRLPSHFCGIAGIKPSAGRVPRTGHAFPFGGIQDAMQQIGPLAREVDDLELLLGIIAGPDSQDPGVLPLAWRDSQEVDVAGLRVSYHLDNGIATPTPETVRTVEEVAARLSGFVGDMERVRPSGLEYSFDVGMGLIFWDGGAGLQRLLAEAGTEEHSFEALLSGGLPPVDLNALVVAWDQYRNAMHAFMSEYDAILCPVNAAPAPLHGATAGGIESVRGYSYTLSYNVTGWPGAVVRAGTSPEGLPIGVQIVAGPGREDIALALARVVESEFGGFQRPTL